MKRRLVISPPISRRIRDFSLPREVLLHLLTDLHQVLPVQYGSSKYPRLNDGREFFYRMIISGADKEHLFVAIVDDTTFPDHLVISDIAHAIR